MTPVERVARALRSEDWDTIPEGLREEYRIVARAAITALAEAVSDEMVAAGSGELPRPDKFGFWQINDFRNSIRAAILAALEQKK